MGFTGVGQQVLNDSARFMVHASKLAIMMRRNPETREYEPIPDEPPLPVGHVERDGLAYAVVTLPPGTLRPWGLAAFGFTLGAVSRITGPGHVIAWIAEVDNTIAPGDAVEFTAMLS